MSQHDCSAPECALGAPSRPFPNRPKVGLVGRYRADGTIHFDRQPREPWDFMATGTGTTVVTVNAVRDLRVQVNHAGALDSEGVQHALGVLHLDWSSQPLAANKGFRMTHDLRRSLIAIEMRTEKQGIEGALRIEVRAHKELDVIRIDVFDDQQYKDGLRIRFDADHSHETAILPGQAHLTWHVNRESIVRKSYEASGIRDADKLPDPLLNRCFGMAVAVDVATPGAGWQDHYFTASQQKPVTIWIAGASEAGGARGWRREILRRLKAARAVPREEFIATHERWWSAFWARSCFEPRDADGRFTQMRASWDFYRYYMACCSSEKRPWPDRWLNFLFTYEFRRNSLGDIWGVELYQTLYGVVRTGDAEPLRDRILHRGRLERALEAHCRARFDHPGVITAYTTSYWGCFDGPCTEQESPHLRYAWQGNVWLLLLMWEYCSMHPDDLQSDAILRRCTAGAVTFFQNHYPRMEGGRRVFYPSAAGETWCGVTDSAELVSALHTTLPRLVAMGEARGWKASVVKACRSLFAELPPLPLGRLQLKSKGYQPHPDEKLLNDLEAAALQRERPVVEPGGDLVPAAAFDRCEGLKGNFGRHLPDEISYRINLQHPELFPLWPAKLCQNDPGLRRAALRAYRKRHYRHFPVGWNLDVVFAANLGLVDEVRRGYKEYFNYTHVFACGLAREWSASQAATKGVFTGPGAIPINPSCQGLGTSVVAVIDQLIGDRPDGIEILPCWPRDVGVHFVVHNPLAGRVEVDFEPGKHLRVNTARSVGLTLSDDLRRLFDLEESR